eukprot:2138203-Rhodomonas_salina.1
MQTQIPRVTQNVPMPEQQHGFEVASVSQVLRGGRSVFCAGQGLEIEAFRAQRRALPLMWPCLHKKVAARHALCIINSNTI